jgi:AraC family transcriptional regulator of adaptative response/methylated-DNA-[protein]-cysteine methyltransferase
VSFFATPDAAEAAGYRACRRCEPRHSEPATLRKVRQARDYLDRHWSEPVSLERLGSAVGMSPYHLQRTFKRVVGMTPKAYTTSHRLERMRARLKQGDTVSRATYEAGFGSGSRAYEHAPTALGMTPGTYRKGGRGVTIRYTLLPTSPGFLLAAATQRGLCYVMLGDDEGPLEAELRREFPHASLERDDAAVHGYATVLQAQMTRGNDLSDLPLDVAGSPFQWEVWDALRRIPPGETRTYGSIARELGRPGAARAVGRACATNPLSLVIPCHRAIRGDGDLGGYRWGLERKRRLLESERERDSLKPETMTAS